MMLSLVFVTVVLASAVANCPEGFVSHPTFGKCYKFVSDPLPFAMAEMGCQSFGGHLSSIKDSFENSMLAETAISQKLGSAFFIGYNRLLKNTWTWTDGYNASTFTNWATNQPVFSSQCIVEALNTSWISVDCSSAYPYVCATTAAFQPPTCSPCPKLPTCPPAHPRPGHCQDGWSYFSKTVSCYKHFLWATFDDAEEVCISNGGHLTSIHSAEENIFISELSKSGMVYNKASDLTWIGIKQANYSDDVEWTWTDGTPYDFKNWAPGQPDNIKRAEHCGQINSDYIGKNPASDYNYQHWNDIVCTIEMRAYVCKKPAFH